MSKKLYKRKLTIKKLSNEKKLIDEGNLYDKIFKENAESIFLPLVEQRLGVKIKTFKPLKEKRQTTLEREMDFFYEVETVEGELFLLHLEFQTEDEKEMVYRNGEYHGIALRQKKMEIRHIVIYLGTTKPQMPTKLSENEIYRGFELINVYELQYEALLQSQVPDVILLAILANYPPEKTESVLRLLITKLKATSKNKSQLSKYIKQLIVLSRLRKIENLTIKITKEMPITYDIKTDYLYQQGIEQGIGQGFEKGIEQGIEKGIEQGMNIKDYENKVAFVESLLLNTDFDLSKIAMIVSVSLDFVKEVKRTIGK